MALGMIRNVETQQPCEAACPALRGWRAPRCRSSTLASPRRSFPASEEDPDVLGSGGHLGARMIGQHKRNAHADQDSAEAAMTIKSSTRLKPLIRPPLGRWPARVPRESTASLRPAAPGSRPARPRCWPGFASRATRGRRRVPSSDSSLTDLRPNELTHEKADLG